MWLDYCWFVWVGLTTHLALNPHAQSCGRLSVLLFLKPCLSFHWPPVMMTFEAKTLLLPLCSYVWCCKCELSIGQTGFLKRLEIHVGGQTSRGKMQKSKLQTSENFPGPSHHFHTFWKECSKTFYKTETDTNNSGKTEKRNSFVEDLKKIVYFIHS